MREEARRRDASSGEGGGGGGGGGGWVVGGEDSNRFLRVWPDRSERERHGDETGDQAGDHEESVGDEGVLEDEALPVHAEERDPDLRGERGVDDREQHVLHG